MSIGRSLILKTAAFPPVQSMVRRSFLFRPVVHRFIAGDGLEEALGHSEDLARRGLCASMDNLGENVASLDEAVRAKGVYIEMLDRIAQSEFRDKINISIKLTQCGLDLGDDLGEKHFRDVLAAAQRTGNTVTVDMEGSDYTERTIAMMERVFPDYPNTGTVLQSYLFRSLDDTRRLIRLGCTIRVVKGAYLEPASIAYPSKADVDTNYLAMAELLLREGKDPAIATHDERLIKAVKDFVAREGIGKDRFEFQMLYGIRRDLQEKLHQEGYRVRVYVPYGESWYPYFTRRLAERPANALFILKSLFRG